MSAYWRNFHVPGTWIKFNLGVGEKILKLDSPDRARLVSFQPFLSAHISCGGGNGITIRIGHGAFLNEVDAIQMGFTNN